ncbi:MAG TPA: R3H domain-containing nucleic acid-binding protein [Thermomicrobiales bacterium]|nr:R3H domain-containing nucleic acid-binding protein [Thermomicrobiales bacterium]
MTTIQPQPVADPDDMQMNAEIAITDNLDDLLAVLPDRISEAVRAMMAERDDPGLIELVLDLGRRPEARFQEGAARLTDDEVTREDLAQVALRIGRFGDDNRAGIERTLHRISAIRNRTGDIVGLTCRVGRAVYGTIGIISDLVESGESILLLGRPGVGKTTMLREVARVLADDLEKRVVVVDTSNEIAGDGDIPHPSIGRARRMQVPTPALQHAVMIEAVENHMPEVIVIDEIGTELEAAAARTIAERGVQLIGTAHGNTLENLMMNPTLSDLIGGIQSVTLSDEEARRRGTQKSILERKAPPTFGVMVEIRERDVVAVVRDVEGAVDAILRGQQQRAELRERHEDGEVVVTDIAPTRPERVDRHERGERQTVRTSRRDEPRVLDSGGMEPEEETEPPQRNPLARGRGTAQRPVRIFPFGVSRNRLEQAISTLALPASIVRDVHEADMVLTLKNYYRQRPQQLREAEARGVAIYVLRANTVVQMVNVLRDLVREVRPDDLPDATPIQPPAQGDGDPITNAMYEAEEAITAVLDGAPPIELRPQAPYIRRLQHQLADRYNLGSRSRGREPHRHVEIFREGGWG